MKKKLTLLLTCLFIGIGLVTAQTRQVQGVVLSEEDGQPIVGASILVLGTNLGVISDMDGHFVLSNVPKTAKELKVSYVGMQTVKVGIKPNLKITLRPNAELLDEVVVTAYGTAAKGTFTGSAGVMKSEKLEARQVSNLSDALSGAIAGVQVLNNNGQPGTESTIRIRGVGSINAGMDPLYVIDGVPFDGDLSSINTQDIESMTVLKDAASTALYGARGANGIIMITTKQAKSGKATVHFDAKIGVNQRGVKNYDVFDSTNEYMLRAYQAIYNSAVHHLPSQDPYAYANSKIFTDEGGGIGYRIYTTPTGENTFIVNQNGGFPIVTLNPNSKLGYSDGTFYYTPDNWSDNTFSNNMRQEYNFNVSASTDRLNYYLSFGYLDDEGLIDNSGFTRYTGRLKADYKVYDWFKVGANAAYTYSNSKYPGEQTTTNSSGNAFLMANYIAPVYPLYSRNPDGTIMTVNGVKIYDYGSKGDSNIPTTNFDRTFMKISNPLGDLAYNKEEYLMDILNLSWYAELKPFKGFTFTARYGLNIDNTRYNSLGNIYLGQSSSYGGTAYQQAARTSGFDQQYIANYQFSINTDHVFDLTVGYDGYSFETTNVDASGQCLYNPYSYYVDNAINQKKGYGSRNEYATEGYFGRLNYSYLDKYIGSLSYRRDGSSRFASDNRWGNFYSASAAWVLTKEDFMEDVSWLNLLKFKASIGQQGNDDIRYGNNTKNYYPYLDQFKMTGAEGVFSDGTLYYKGNYDITWETSTSYNIGFDFAMFNNSLKGTLEYFGRKSSDMLYNKPVSPSAGYTSIPMNIGSMTNQGLELGLNYMIFNQRDFNWSVDFNATFVKNKINELHPDLHGKLIDGTRIYEEGSSMYRMYLVKYAGVDKTNSDPAQQGKALYYAKRKLEDGTEEVYKTYDYSVAADTYKVGTADLMPDVYGGLSTSLYYKGIDFSVQCAYQLGGQVYDDGYQDLMHGCDAYSGGKNWHTDIRNSWTPDNPNSDIPRVDALDKYTNSTSDRWLESSDYFAINNLTVGYTLPKQLTEKLLVNKLRVYFAADNLVLFSARKGLDPRQSYISSSTARYTSMRTISGGISLTF